MKHKLSITLILLGMFLVTQFIGLFVVNTYAPQIILDPATGETTIAQGNELPFGLETPEDEPTPNFLSLIFSFALAFAIIFTLMKYKWKMVIRLWFFVVVTLALGIALNAFLKYTTLTNVSIIALAIAIPIAFIKIFKPNMLVHNATELFIYPGIAAVFVPILTPISVIALLILISIYDMWAVWKSGIMQKMAKFQMGELKIFGGFLIPSFSKKTKIQIEKIKQKYKNKKIPAKIKKKKFKVSLAILGGGDVIFPIITAGVFMRAFGIIPAIFIIFGALAGLGFLFSITEKGKSYPAMPYISVGIFLGMLIWKLFLF
ncbi:MAG: presenilin family intramembrane aspartyl protease [Nanoarchaeota archaeon]|nr:presenilin family intramembrane aspartyl protease [Nanoarchaeota archaeon]